MHDWSFESFAISKTDQSTTTLENITMFEPQTAMKQSSKHICLPKQTIGTTTFVNDLSTLIYQTNTTERWINDNKKIKIFSEKIEMIIILRAIDKSVNLLD